MTDQAAIAMWTAIPIIVAQIVNIYVSSRNKKALGEVKEETKAIKEETKVITGHVNSAATAAAAKIDSLEKQIIELRNILAEKKEVASLLAQAKATSDATNIVAPAQAVQYGEKLTAGAQPTDPISVIVENEPHNPVPIIPAIKK